MSDLDQSDVADANVDPAAPPVEPTPVEPSPVEPTPVEPSPVEPTAEELQAEIDDLKAAIEAQNGPLPNPQIDWPARVIARTPSSASATQEPETAPVVEREPLPLADAVQVLIGFVKAHRTAGDSDLEAALADVEASLAAQA